MKDSQASFLPLALKAEGVSSLPASDRLSVRPYDQVCPHDKF